MSADSNASSALDLPRPMIRGGLPALPRADRAAGFLLHAAPLVGLVLPLIGHLAAPALVMKYRRRQHPSIAGHWPAVRAEQTRWGVACALAYAGVAVLGLGGIFLALAVVAPWAILVVISASQVEDGQSVRRSWWPI